MSLFGHGPAARQPSSTRNTKGSLLTTFEKILFRKAGIEARYAELFPEHSLQDDWPGLDARLVSFNGSFPTLAGDTIDAPAISVSRAGNGAFDMQEIERTDARDRIQTTLAALFEVAASNRELNASVVYVHEKE
jgi:hypothetical protein